MSSRIPNNLFVFTANQSVSGSNENRLDQRETSRNNLPPQRQSWPRVRPRGPHTLQNEFVASATPTVDELASIYENQMTSWSFSMGPQGEFDGVGHFADCGQYAEDSAFYAVGSIDPITGEEQAPAIRNPGDMEPAHGRSAESFANLPVPQNATMVAYYNIESGSFHYGKIHRGNNGVVSHFSHADSSADIECAPGGTLRVFSTSMRLIAQRGIQPPAQLDDSRAFVEYCEKTYGPGIYFFAK